RYPENLVLSSNKRVLSSRKYLFEMNAVLKRIIPPHNPPLIYGSFVLTGGIFNRYLTPFGGCLADLVEYSSAAAHPVYEDRRFNYLLCREVLRILFIENRRWRRGGCRTWRRTGLLRHRTECACCDQQGHASRTL